MSGPVTKQIPPEDLLQMPRNDLRYELIEGELNVREPAGYEHGKITVRITLSLGNHVAANNLGEVCAAETGFLIATDPATVRAPDVAFVSRQRAREAGTGKGYFPGAPDLAIEVMSPGDEYNDVQAKALGWKPEPGWW